MSEKHAIQRFTAEWRVGGNVAVVADFGRHCQSVMASHFRRKAAASPGQKSCWHAFALEATGHVDWTAAVVVGLTWGWGAIVRA